MHPLFHLQLSSGFTENFQNVLHTYWDMFSILFLVWIFLLLVWTVSFPSNMASILSTAAQGICFNHGPSQVYSNLLGTILDTDDLNTIANCKEVCNFTTVVISPDNGWVPHGHCVQKIVSLVVWEFSILHWQLHRSMKPNCGFLSGLYTLQSASQNDRQFTTTPRG